MKTKIARLASVIAIASIAFAGMPVYAAGKKKVEAEVSSDSDKAIEIGRAVMDVGSDLPKWKGASVVGYIGNGIDFGTDCLAGTGEDCPKTVLSIMTLGGSGFIENAEKGDVVGAVCSLAGPVGLAVPLGWAPVAVCSGPKLLKLMGSNGVDGSKPATAWAKTAFEARN